MLALQLLIDNRFYFLLLHPLPVDHAVNAHALFAMRAFARSIAHL
jgi:hypothetical protein